MTPLRGDMAEREIQLDGTSVEAACVLVHMSIWSDMPRKCGGNKPRGRARLLRERDAVMPFSPMNEFTDPVLILVDEPLC